MKLWLPDQGYVSTDVWRVDQAVKAYDERLSFKFNDETQEWCVFIRMPGSAPAVPVLGFGASVPQVDVAMERLVRSDAKRNGEKIYDDMLRSQEKYRAELEYAASQASEEAAEPTEWLLRKHGKSPIVKSFSKGVSNNDAG
jgi:hypothetical protein